MKNMNDGKGEILVYMISVCYIQKCASVYLLTTQTCPLLTESSALSNTSLPHIIPVLSLLERGMALGEGLEPWESAEVGVDVVMYHLEAARTIAHHGGIYKTNAETKLQGKDKGNVWKEDLRWLPTGDPIKTALFFWESLL